MIANGFKRTVEINGRSFHLPHAEYDFEAELSAFQVADIAKPIINPIWKDYLILVTTATERAGVLVPVA